MAALPADDATRRDAPTAFRSHARDALATFAAALGQSQPGMLTALSMREDALLALLGMLAYLPTCWRQAARGGAEEARP